MVFSWGASGLVVTFWLLGGSWCRQAPIADLQPFLAKDGSLGYRGVSIGRKRLAFWLLGSELPVIDGHYWGVYPRRQLMDVMQRLVDKGNSILVIEHNLDVIRCADWIVDLGPEGGDKGGEIVVTGTPEEVAEHPTSQTGRYLKQVLEQHPPEVVVG